MSYASYNGEKEAVEKENQAAPVEDRGLVVESYRMMKKLGEGKFGKVILAQHLQDKKCFAAIKIISKENVSSRNILRIVENEFNIMKQLDSRMFPTLIAVTQSSQNVYFLMENCVFGDFRSLLKDQNLGCMYQDEVPFYMDELMIGIQYLHKKDIIHQDLKLDNLLLTSDHHLKICDFGLSQTGVKENTKLHMCCGTMANMPPEKITRGWYTRLSDWWSYGIILLEMFGYRNPFLRDVKKDTVIAITTISKKFEKRVVAAPPIPEVAMDLTNELLQYEDCRIPPHDIPNHKFFDELKRQKVENSPLEPPLLIPNLTRNTRHLENSTEEIEPFRFAAFGGGDDGFENFYYRRPQVILVNVDIARNRYQPPNTILKSNQLELSSNFELWKNVRKKDHPVQFTIDRRAPAKWITDLGRVHIRERKRKSGDLDGRTNEKDGVTSAQNIF